MPLMRARVWGLNITSVELTLLVNLLSRWAGRVNCSVKHRLPAELGNMILIGDLTS